MTVCIAAIARLEGYRATYGIVAAADHMLSVETAPGVTEGFETPHAKCFQFGDTAIALFSGPAANAKEIRNAAVARLRRQSRSSIRQVADALGKASVESFRVDFQRKELDPLRTTIEAIHRAESGLDPAIVRQLRYDFRGAETGCDWIVAGVDHAGAKLYFVSGRGVVQAHTSDAFVAIGAGADIASYELRRIPHHHTRWVGSALFDVYAAKRSAEAIHGVGREQTTVIAIDSAGCRYAARPGRILVQMETVYAEREAERRAPNITRMETLQNTARALLSQTPIAPDQATAAASSPSNPTTSSSDQT